MDKSHGEPGRAGEPAQGSVGGRGGEGTEIGGAGGVGGERGAVNVRDSIEDVRGRMADAAVQITAHIDNAQSELDALRRIVDALIERVQVLEDIEEHRG